MIRIRDEDGHVVAAGPLGVVVERCATHPVERVDLWQRDNGHPDTVGIVWADQCLTVFDMRDARQWLDGQPALRDLVRVHGPGVAA